MQIVVFECPEIKQISYEAAIPMILQLILDIKTFLNIEEKLVF